MDTEYTIITLPNGAKAYLKSKVTHGDARKIMAVMADVSMVNPQTQEFRDVPLSVQLHMNQTALECLLVKLVMPDGSVVANPVEAVDNMGEDEVKALFDKIDEMTLYLFASKKNS